MTLFGPKLLTPGPSVVMVPRPSVPMGLARRTLHDGIGALAVIDPRYPSGNLLSSQIVPAYHGTSRQNRDAFVGFLKRLYHTDQVAAAIQLGNQPEPTFRTITPAGPQTEAFTRFLDQFPQIVEGWNDPRALVWRPSSQLVRIVQDVGAMAEREGPVSDWMVLQYAPGIFGKHTTYVIVREGRERTPFSIYQIEANYSPSLDNRRWNDLCWATRDFANAQHATHRYQQLQDASRLDSLTGLLNRRAFEEVLGQAIARFNADPSSGSVVLLLLDVNGFKWFNDTLGHAIGDFVLRKGTEYLKRSFREGDILARTGGDEIAVLIEGVRNREEVISRLDRFYGNTDAHKSLLQEEIRAELGVVSRELLISNQRRLTEFKEGTEGVDEYGKTKAYYQQEIGILEQRLTDLAGTDLSPALFCVSVGISIYATDSSARLLMEQADLAGSYAKRESRRAADRAEDERGGSPTPSRYAWYSAEMLLKS